ncbi:MAG: hypothetical protein Q9227_002069 [Pyrenula ochraceoflavens]
MGSRSREPAKFADPQLLQKIDKLFACNVGQYVSLPQLVVVGDQSSGKSSVLEGVTGIAFPRDSGLCTRYATQIIFRRSTIKSTTVSIIHAPGTDHDTAKRLNDWNKTDIDLCDQEAFAEMISEVGDMMGIGEGKGTFSEHVLQIEIADPDQQHLSVIDVPGIFRTPSPDIGTTLEDIDIVRDMVKSYMENARSIMLVVVPSNIDIATQEILQMAENFDKDGQRTLGVLTKPDLIDPGAESTVIELLQGKRHKLRLGWTVLRNPGKQDLEDPSFDRNEAELNFFKTKKKWSEVDPDKKGASALRSKLQEVLTTHVRREFPSVRKEITQRLRAAQQSRDSLGPARDQLSDQRNYLTKIATEFYNITFSATRAQYDQDVFDENPVLRLATKVANRNASFERDMKQRGHLYQFSKGGSVDSHTHAEETDQDDKHSGDLPKDLEPENDADEKLSDAGEAFQHPTRKRENHLELYELMAPNFDIPEPQGNDIIAWLDKLHHDSRGLTLESFSSSLVPKAVKNQCSKWEMIAKGYISDVVSVTHKYILLLLRTVCPDDRVRDELFSVLLEKLLSKYEKAVKHVEFVIRVEASDPMTLNPHFGNTLEHVRQERKKSAVLKVANESPHKDEGDKWLLVNSIATAPLSNAQHTVQDLHDVLQSYYKTAQERFVDNVCMQGAVYHLIKGPDTPLRVFYPDLVNGLSDAQIERIAGEEMSTRNKRKSLNEEISGLQEGMKILA